MAGWILANLLVSAHPFTCSTPRRVLTHRIRYRQACWALRCNESKVFLTTVTQLHVLLTLSRCRYQHLNAVSLSLPLSSASTIAAILLPVLSFLNTLYYNFHSLSSTRAGSRDPVFLPQALQVLQTIFATVLATTFYSDISSDSAQRCLLSTRWQKLWSDHDSAAVRRIQDTWDCCGFNSIKDRAWPFPHKGSPQPDCATQWGRTIACGQPWGGAMRQSAGLEFGIVVVVSLLQVSWTTPPFPSLGN